MAETDTINLDPLIMNMLQQSSNNAKANAGLPSVNQNVPPAPALVRPIRPGEMGSSFYDRFGNVGVAGAGSLGMLSPEDAFLLGAAPKSKQQLVEESGILNEGIPTELRFDLSKTTLFDPELQKKNVDYNLRRYFEGEGLITDDYDFGLRVGPVSERLEFKDPRFDGKYNVLDPFGAKDIIGDIADISVDTLLPIATEVTAGVGSMMIPGVGQVPITPILAGATAAFATSYGRLKYAQNQNLLSPDVTDDDIIGQALDEAGYSALFGVGGTMVFAAIKPVLRAMGLASPKLAVDIDEDAFLTAFNKYKNSEAGQKAEKLGFTPSSAQMLEAAAKMESAEAARLGGLTPSGGAALARAGEFQGMASELAKLEKTVATSPATETGEAVLAPSRASTLAAETAIKTEAAGGTMPEGVISTSQRLGEADLASLGSGIQKVATDRASQQIAQLDSVVNRELDNIETVIESSLNLPPTVRATGDIGVSAKEAVNQSYDTASAAIGKAYEDLFDRWSKSTGISIDSVQLGKGGIKPTEAVDFAIQIRNTLPDRPFAAPSDNQVITKVLDSFLVAEKGAARKVKPISLRTLNENIRDLRRLERKAYNAAQRGEDAPSPEVITGMVESLETARNRVISRKDAPEGLADELRVLDDTFAQFSQKFRGVTTSAVAKLRTAKNPEQAWNLLFQKDSTGGTAVLDIAEELNTPANRDLFQDVGDTIRKKWLDEVVTKGKGGQLQINIGKHNNFLKNYGSAMDAYLTTAEKAAMGSANDFAEQVTQIQARQKASLQKINQQLELGGGKNVEPETIFEQSWRNKRFTRFNELYTTLRQDPMLMDTYKAFVYKDMFDPAAGRVQTINGRQVLDPKQMRIYLDENKDKIRTLLGQDYLNNMRIVLDATESALTEVPARLAREESNLLTGIIRGYVGMFTRPGRFLTAANRMRGRAKENAMTMALSDPQVLAEMAKASKKSILSKEAERTMGKLYFGRYESPTTEGEGYRRPNKAQAMLEELYAGNR